MIVKSNVDNFSISESLTVKSALKKLDEFAMQILFVVDNKKYLKGVITDGDIRRWLLDSKDPDLNSPIIHAANTNYVSALKNQSHEKISNLLSNSIKAIPITDDEGILISVAIKEDEKIVIGGRTISRDEPAFIIAEIGNNHQGDLDIAKTLIDKCIDAGVDCVKFQMRTMDSLYKNDSKSVDISADLGSQYTLDLLSKFQLGDEDLYKIFDYCNAKGVIPLCTPWDLDSLKKLDSYGLSAFKIASADFTNHELLEAASNLNKPLICSTGMSKENEIYETSDFLKRLGAETVFLHCNSTYPTPYKDINLNYLTELRKITDSIVGYSGHERGYFIPLAAITLGAKVIEKHVTLDKSQEGNDHKVSLLPEEFKMMMRNIRDIEESLGTKKSRDLTQGELLNREVLAKSLVANTPLRKGEIITRKMISIKSPGNGIQPNRLNELVGKKANRDIASGDFFYETDLKPIKKIKEKFNFDRPFGVPVRYHDFEKISKKVNLDFVEFHLSYQDLNEDPSDFISNSELGFSVHCPELFEEDHILDLCSLDEDYRSLSIKHLKRVLEHIKDIDKCFVNKNQDLPVLIINAGGWNQDGFIDEKEKEKRYQLLKKSLSEVDHSSVTIAIQTMPPFPWHFGGQSFHNLFVSPSEIDRFCRDTSLGICLDVSHSMMACNYYGWDLIDFIEKTSSHIKYLHIVDALGADGEGIQIGKGDVNFDALGKILFKKCKNIPFIPEIWQGHKNNGAAFWDALDFLEPFMQNNQ